MHFYAQGVRWEFESFTADIPNFLNYVGRKDNIEEENGLKWMLKVWNSW